MLEWEAIEGWLELEAEISFLATSDGTEIPIGLLAKKPFRLSPWAEMMIDVGPEIVRTSNATYFGGQLAFDFMFWPSRPVGLWIEPSYDVIAREGVSHGIGATGGVLFGW